MKLAINLCRTGLVATILLSIACLGMNAHEHHVLFGEDLYVGVGSYGRRFHPRLVFFNDGEYGPYRGSLIGLSDGHGGMVSDVIASEYVGDTAGIYYRWFLWPEGPQWTLMVSLWYLAGFFLLHLWIQTRSTHLSGKVITAGNAERTEAM